MVDAQTSSLARSARAASPASTTRKHLLLQKSATNSRPPPPRPTLKPGTYSFTVLYFRPLLHFLLNAVAIIRLHSVSSSRQSERRQRQRPNPSLQAGGAGALPFLVVQVGQPSRAFTRPFRMDRNLVSLSYLCRSSGTVAPLVPQNVSLDSVSVACLVLNGNFTTSPVVFS